MGTISRSSSISSKFNSIVGIRHLSSWVSNLQSHFSKFKRRFLSNLEGIDLFLLGLILFMTSMGLLMLYSASFIYAQERFADGFWFIKRQAIFAVMGFVALLGAYQIELKFWYKWRLVIFLTSLSLLVFVLIPGVGVRVGGAQRWIHLGLLNFQPAELTKFATILFFSGQLVRKRGLMTYLFWICPVMVLLLMQPDFGSSVMIAAVVLAILFLGGVSWKQLVFGLGAAILGGATLILSSPYRMARLMTFLDPWKDPLGKGFQILQSMVGLHHGQFWGVGLGNSKEKLFFLPEAHSDFIFAVIGEELGFIGVVLVLLCFLALIYRGLLISRRIYLERQDPFASSLAAGITLLLGLQGLVNMAVVLGLLPTKGLALPFVSYGGSGLLIDLFAIGVLLRTARGSVGS